MTQNYFQSLNYSMANEDTTLEYELGRRTGAKKILTVGGSGSRALPFLALPLSELRIVDVSADQLLLIQLKLQTIRQLSHSDAVRFWTGEDALERKVIFEKMKLEERFKQFFDFHSIQNPDRAPLYWGKWEKPFQTFSKIISTMFSEEVREGIFTCKEPWAYYQKHIKGLRWNLLLKIIGNKAMFNSLLYKGDFIKKNSALSYFDYYHQAFERLFKLDVNKSHFLQLCFCGKVVTTEGLPIEFRPDIFELIKRSTLEPIYQQGSIFERHEDTQYDLISLSDVPSYLGGDIEKNYIQALAKNVAPHGIIVNRFYLRNTENTDLKGFQVITEKHQDLSERELVQMYDVQLLQKSVH